MKEINSFSGQYRFLSNFYLHPVTYAGVTYPSVENAYQAQKTLDENERLEFTSISPAKAKNRGRQVDIRPGWEKLKIQVMYELLKMKFNSGELKVLLLATSGHQLVEGNWWGDTFWGRCDGKGKNKLGQLLMKVRRELLDEYRYFGGLTKKRNRVPRRAKGV